jgi:hypothetical protein
MTGSGTPDHGVDRSLGAVWSLHPVRREADERPDAPQDTRVTSFAHRWHHHDVAQAHCRRERPPFLLRRIARGGLLEEEAAVNVIQQEARRLQCYPGDISDLRDLGQNLRGRVTRTDDQDAPPGKRRWRPVVRRVDLQPPGTSPVPRSGKFTAGTTFRSR